MLEKVNKEVVACVLKAHIPMQAEAQEATERRRSSMANMQTRKDDVQQNPNNMQDTRQPQKRMPIHNELKIGRNDPCPCGSGKKYKNCHGRAGAEELA